jgi:predicted histone-like DNA-binding protein|nr:MAG TPA: DNA-binding protein [Caudoviricetes sp.]
MFTTPLPRLFREKTAFIINSLIYKVMVNYSLALMSSKPGDDKAAKLFYAKAQASGEITMDEMAEQISYATSLTDGDVLNAIRALIKQVNLNLAAGKIVRLENFGTFQIQLCSDGAETEKKFTSANITGAHIQFRPGRPIKAATRAGEGGLTFKRVAKLGEAPLPDGNPGSGTGGDGEDQEENPLG